MLISPELIKASRGSVQYQEPTSGNKTEPIRISIVGTGAVAIEYHLPAIRYLGAALSVLADANQASLKAAAKQHRPHLFTTDVSHITRDNTDICVVATPPATHLTVAECLLRAGVSVLVEKPVVTTAGDLDRLTASISANTKCYCAQVRRFFPNIQLMRQIIHSQVFGRVTRIQITEGAPFKWTTTSSYLSDQADEGVITDMGAHVLDLITFLGAPNINACRIKKCASDRYPQTNNLLFVFEDTDSDICYDVRLSRVTHLAGRLVVTTEAALIVTAPTFTMDPLDIYPLTSPTAKPFNISIPVDRENVRYAFVKQLIEAARDAGGQPDRPSSIISLDSVRPTVDLFELIRRHLSVEVCEVFPECVL